MRFLVPVSLLDASKRSRVIPGCAALLMLMSTVAHGATLTLVNNGLAPPNPDNIYTNPPVPSAFDIFVIRNVGCPPGWPGSGSASDPCPSPGASTAAEVAAGAFVGFPIVHDSSDLLISGGDVVGLVNVFDDSTLTITGSSGYLAGFERERQRRDDWQSSGDRKFDRGRHRWIDQPVHIQRRDHGRRNGLRGGR